MLGEIIEQSSANGNACPIAVDNIRTLRTRFILKGLHELAEIDPAEMYEVYDKALKAIRSAKILTGRIIAKVVPGTNCGSYHKKLRVAMIEAFKNVRIPYASAEPYEVPPGASSLHTSNRHNHPAAGDSATSNTA